MTRSIVGLSIVAVLAATPACKQAEVAPAGSAIGEVTTHLSYALGSAWDVGYSIDVFPGRMVVVESRACPMGRSKDRGTGFCVIPITKEQSDRFEAAMSRFKRNAVPLQSVDLHADWKRPDGKACKSQVTDDDLLTLTWTNTKGVQVVAFYTGCDQDEYEGFYRDVRALTHQLPVGQLISRN